MSRWGGYTLHEDMSRCTNCCPACGLGLPGLRITLILLRSLRPIVFSFLDLGHFYTTDSVACSTRWLAELVAAREAKGQPRQVTIVPCAPVIAAWIQTTQDVVLRKQSAVQLPAIKLAKLAPLAIAAAVGALMTMAVMRSR